MTGTTTSTGISSTNVGKRIRLCVQSAAGSFPTNRTVSTTWRGNTRSCWRRWTSTSAPAWSCSRAAASRVKRTGSLRAPWPRRHHPSQPSPHNNCYKIIASLTFLQTAGGQWYRIRNYVFFWIKILFSLKKASTSVTTICDKILKLLRNLNVKSFKIKL